MLLRVQVCKGYSNSPAVWTTVLATRSLAEAELKGGVELRKNDYRRPGGSKQQVRILVDP